MAYKLLGGPLDGETVPSPKDTGIPNLPEGDPSHIHVNIGNSDEESVYEVVSADTAVYVEETGRTMDYDDLIRQAKERKYSWLNDLYLAVEEDEDGDEEWKTN